MKRKAYRGTAAASVALLLAIVLFLAAFSSPAYAEENAGWKQSEDRWYYYLADGSLATGWKKLDDGWHYFDPSSGAECYGWVKTRSGWYYLSSDGIMQTGWLRRGGRWYYLDPDGRMVTGWQKVDGKWYYFDPDSGAAFQDGWKKTDDGYWFYYDSDANAATGWKSIGGVWYYFQDDGTMTTGWLELGDGWHYFASSGAERTGWIKLRSKWYYLDSNGVMQTGWVKSRGLWYYLDENGAMATGWKLVNGRWYYFNESSGAAYCDGWAERDGQYRHYFDTNAEPLTGWQVIDGEQYCFQDDGTMVTDWIYDPTDGNLYYFFGRDSGIGEWGAMAHNVTVGDTYFPESGGVPGAAKSYMINTANSFSSPSSYLIFVDTTECSVGIFTGSSYNWELLYYWQCAPGAAETPTVTGVFSVGSRGTYFDSGSYRCHYYTQFYGAYLFHSVLYDHYGNLADGRVGMNLSHGCVRLPIERAYWIYSTIPSGTTVYVY